MPGAALRLLRDDPDVVVWTLARLEMLSALARRGRDEPAAARQLRLVRRHFLDAWERWSEVTAADIEARGRKALALQVDVTKEADCAAMAAAAWAAHGPIDIVIANAGAAASAPSVRHSSLCNSRPAPSKPAPREIRTRPTKAAVVPYAASLQACSQLYLQS